MRSLAGADMTRLAWCARPQLFVGDLMDALGQHPPPQPSRMAVDLLVAVGQQQEYLAAHGLLPPHGHPGALDALRVRAQRPLACLFWLNATYNHSNQAKGICWHP